MHCTYLLIAVIITITLMEIFSAVTIYKNNKFLTDSSIIISVYIISISGWLIDWVFYYIVFSFYMKFKKPEYLR